jgi:thiopeptide-type bacteriocin biosynthesis protein
MAIKRKNMKWISLHIFYTGNTIRLIQQCIKPLIHELFEKKFITTYFFILYPENGDHIRLRLKSECETVFIYNLCNDRIGQYFTSNPSENDINRPAHYYSNDTVIIIPYEPEYERYGGEVGIRIAEQEFRNSSDIVLEYLDELSESDNNYVAILNIAIKLHLASSYMYCGKSIEQAILFFQLIYNGFTTGSSFPLLKFNNYIEQPYNDVFQNQKEILIPFVSAIWKSFDNNEIIDEELEQCKINEFEINKALYQAYNSNQLQVQLVYENYPSWSIFQSYVHMTNNRLGIKPVDEPLIAYFLMRSLIELQ